MAAVPGRIRHIVEELRTHAPFTLAGALSGIALMLVFRRADPAVHRTLFSVFHPGHVVLSAMVTASLFQLHRKARDFVRILLIGYLGSVGIATLSDCIVPFLGESVLGVAVPTHAGAHDHAGPGAESEPIIEGADHETDGETNHEAGHEMGHETDHGSGDESDHAHRPRLHLGFIEEWYLVNPAAILGVCIAYLLPRTRLPHALHVLISTWASSAHMLMNTRADWGLTLAAGMFMVLFVAVWLPCCISDIVFPMLFVDATPNHGHCWRCRHDHGRGDDGGESPRDDGDGDES